MTIGESIAKFRKLKGVSSKDMADALGVSANYLSLIENNKKSPSTKTLADIADYLGIPLSALLFVTLESRDFNNAKNQKLFNEAKPIIDKMLKILISEKEAIKKLPGKRKTASLKRVHIN